MGVAVAVVGGWWNAGVEYQLLVCPVGVTGNILKDKD